MPSDVTQLPMPVKAKLIQESLLESTYKESIATFWQEKVTQGQVQNGEVVIPYAFVLHENALNSVVISSGRVEALIKYKEVIYNFYNMGYSVFIHDHRGQGLASRLTPRHDLGYVDSFSDYVDDFDIFFREVIEPNISSKPLLLCHSMGCAIGCLFMLKFPERFSKAALSAPMFGIKPSLPDWVVNTLLGVSLASNAIFGRKPWYLIGQTGYHQVPYKLNTLTQSKIRYKLFKEEYDNTPQAKLGGVGIHWMKAAHQAMNHIAEQASQIKVPILMLQADADKIVDNQKQDLVFESLPKAKKVVIEGAYHELLMEADRFRDICMQEIVAFFQGE